MLNKISNYVKDIKTKYLDTKYLDTKFLIFYTKVLFLVFIWSIFLFLLYWYLFPDVDVYNGPGWTGPGNPPGPPGGTGPLRPFDFTFKTELKKFTFDDFRDWFSTELNTLEALGWMKELEAWLGNESISFYNTIDRNRTNVSHSVVELDSAFVTLNLDNAVYLSALDYLRNNPGSVLGTEEVIIHVMNEGITRWPGQDPELDALADFVSRSNPSTANDIRDCIASWDRQQTQQTQQIPYLAFMTAVAVTLVFVVALLPPTTVITNIVLVDIIVTNVKDLD